MLTRKLKDFTRIDKLVACSRVGRALLENSCFLRLLQTLRLRNLLRMLPVQGRKFSEILGIEKFS